VVELELSIHGRQFSFWILNHEGHEGHEEKIKKKQAIKVFSYLSLRALRVLRGKIGITDPWSGGRRLVFLLPNWYTKTMAFKGYIQVYTGNGKGKTTAALGLALRAAGRKKKVYIAQFMKKTFYGELGAIQEHLGEYITIKQFGLPDFHHSGKDVTPGEKKAAMAGVEAVKKAIQGKKYHVVILDEANILAHFKIIDIKYLLEIIDNKPDDVELILTGRNAPHEFIKRADLVTEMKEIKHYYKKGIQARIGIEK